MSQKLKLSLEKIDKVNYIKIKNFCMEKNHINKKIT